MFKNSQFMETFNFLLCFSSEFLLNCVKISWISLYSKDAGVRLEFNEILKNTYAWIMAFLIKKEYEYFENYDTT